MPVRTRHAVSALHWPHLILHQIVSRPLEQMVHLSPHQVPMKPGKPVAFAILEGKPVFALPGNPAAAMISFEVFVRPALLKMMGHMRIFRPTVTAALTGSIANKGDRPHLIRVRVEARQDGYAASATGNQSSARLSSLTAANGFVTVSPGTILAAGESVVVSLLDLPEVLS